MSLYHRFCILSVVACSIIVSANGCNKHTSADNAVPPTGSEPAHGERVVAAKPERKELKLYTTQPGRIEAFEEAPLVSKIAGYVEEVAVDIGDKVKKGDVLIKLSVPEMLDDVEQYDALVAQASADIRQAESAISAARSAVKTAEAKRDQAAAGVDAAHAFHQLRESEHKRISELASKGSVTPKLVDETLSQLRSADAAWQQTKAAVKSADAAMEEAGVNVQKSEADLDAVKARLRVAQAHLARAQTMLAYTEIKSPFDGIVTRRDVDTGHFVQPSAGGGSKPLLVVARTDKIRVFVDLPEAEASQAQGGGEGDTATIRVQALGGREFDAKMTRTAWSLNASNRSLRTEIDIDNKSGELRPGMYATATILLASHDNVLALPRSAVIRKGKDSYCYCVQSGKVHQRPIRLGLRSGDQVEVVAGISESDIVVLTRAELLTDGQSVVVTAPE